MTHVLGIDLGTSSSTASVLLNGELHTVPSFEKNNYSEKPFPSVVSFFEDGGCLIGYPALEQSIYNPRGTFKNIKRYMGKDKKFKAFGKEYIPQFLSALILIKIKLSAEELTKEKFEHVIITVPSYFNDVQRQATRDAGRIAGLKVLQIMPEPEAAAIAYGAHKISSKSRIMVFDMGAGTLDVSILEVDSGVFQVLSTSGDTELGGIDMDKSIKDFLLNSDDKLKDTSISDEITMVQVDMVAEKAKIRLSTEEKITIDETISFEKEDYKFKTELTRKSFEKMIDGILRRSETCVNKALQGADLTRDKIDKVILVGGPAKIPAVRNLLKKLIKEPEADVDPMFAVSNGAAIWGANLGGDDNLPVVYKGLVLAPVTPLDLGEEYRDRRTKELSIQVMIPKNSSYPTEYTHMFYANKWMVDQAPMDVWQGDFDLHDWSKYKKIGHFVIKGLEIGQNEIEVTYRLDNDGILTVTAHEKRKGGGGAFAELQITKTGKTIIPTPKLENLKKDAGKIKRKTRDILSPYEIPLDEYKRKKNPKYCWMCECLDGAKKILNEYHDKACSEFFDRSTFYLFLQLDRQYAFGHIQLGGPVYPIGVHNALKENTDPNRRMLTIVLVHELLHALHPDWGHDKIRPEERRLANLAGYYDALKNMEIMFLSGKMCLCNNHFSSDLDFERINCD